MNNKGLGKIQRRILEELDKIENRWLSRNFFEQRWIGLDILIFHIYHREELNEVRRVRDMKFSKNEHRRVWESVRMLEKRGLVKVRKERIKTSGGVRAIFGGIQSWLEVRKI